MVEYTEFCIRLHDGKLTNLCFMLETAQFIIERHIHPKYCTYYAFPDRKATVVQHWQVSVDGEAKRLSDVLCYEGAGSLCDLLCDYRLVHVHHEICTNSWR